jgi:hypothetical protein
MKTLFLLQLKSWDERQGGNVDGIMSSHVSVGFERWGIGCHLFLSLRSPVNIDQSLLGLTLRHLFATFAGRRGSWMHFSNQSVDGLQQ